MSPRSAKGTGDSAEVTEASTSTDPAASTAAVGDVPGVEDAARVKRKRPLGVDPSLIISSERTKRRRSPTPEVEVKEEAGVDPKDKERAKALGMAIYRKIMDSTGSEGESMAEPFIKLPNKRSFPDYYETIKHPMSLEQVRAKLDQSEYDTLKDVVADIGQIFNNAKRYNVKESLIFQYAKKLHKMTKTFYTQTTTPGAESGSEHDEDPEPAAAAAPSRSAQKPTHTAPSTATAPATATAAGSGSASAQRRPEPSASASVEREDVDMGGPSNASADGNDDTPGARGRAGVKRGSYMKDGPTVYKLVKPILKAIRETRSRDRNRDISQFFEVLPDRKVFMDYYRAIERPISLREIEERMVARYYISKEQFYDDVELMCRNAIAYNEDDSDVNRDAQQILEVLEMQKNDVLNRLNGPQVSKFRVKQSSTTPSRHDQRPPYDSYGRGSYPPPGASPGPGQYYPSPHQQGSPLPAQGYPAQGYPPQGVPSPSPSTSAYLPALPKGVVNEDIVMSLSRYPPYEQQAWAASLPPAGIQMYRQITAANEARKNGNPRAPLSNGYGNGSQPAVMTDLPSSGRPNGQPSFPDRHAPPSPTVKYLDFAFASGPNYTHPVSGLNPSLASSNGYGSQGTGVKHAIRLQNMRGVITHAVVLSSDTTELEITAHVAESASSKEKSTTSNAGARTTAGGADQGVPTPQDQTPEVSLRVNGNQGSLPKFIYDDASRSDKATAMRWTISVPASKLETKIEVVATKPGAMAETTCIYVSRQY